MPVVQQLWEKVNDNVNTEEPIFSQISQTLKGILNKDEPSEKSAVEVSEEQLTVDNSMNDARKK